jgi:transposase-like protein
MGLDRGKRAMDTFSEPHFTDSTAARALLERLRWGGGRACPHCGVVDHSFATKKPGVYRCAEKACKMDFTVTTGTVMESSHIALHKWLQAFHLMASSKKGISAHQLHRTIKVTYKSAWFMAHRIREAMRAGGLAAPMGGSGGTVESDETFIGRIKGEKPRPGGAHKNMVLALLDRDTKQVRTFHIDGKRVADIVPIVRENISKEARLITDEGRHYGRVGREFAAHETVDHYHEEYVRYASDVKRREEYPITVNTLEGYFSIFKRGMKGVYQHCSEKHLHRYLAEFEFRYNNRSKLGCEDGERAARALKGAEGKRLTYRQPRSNVVPLRRP